MSRAGVGVLERIHSRFNAPQYVHIMENVMLPSVRVWNPEGNLIFQQDSRPCTAAWAFKDGSRGGPAVELVPWPLKSPDLNFIEQG